MVKLKFLVSTLFFIISLNTYARSVSYCGIENIDFDKTLLQAKGVYLGKVKVENGKVFILVEKSWKDNNLKKIEVEEPDRNSSNRMTDQKLVSLYNQDGKEIIIAHSGISLKPLNLSQRCVVVHVLLANDYLNKYYKKILKRTLGESAK